MIKESTIIKYKTLLIKIQESGLSIRSYFNQKNQNPNTFYNSMKVIKKEAETGISELQELVNLYNKIKKSSNYKEVENIIPTKSEESEQGIIFEFIRDDNYKIQKYNIVVPIKNANPFHIILTREEMDSIYRLYSYYGDNLTQRTISRHFPDLSLMDFKRILRAANITKASSPFARHMIEEKTESELLEIQAREKENSFIRKVEEEQVKNTEKLLKKYALENAELKQKFKNISDIKINLESPLNCVSLPKIEETNKSINLYLSDMHLGSYTVSGSLYEENRKYGIEEIKRRLTEIINKLGIIGPFNTINLVLMGDMIDCCGFTGMTARMDHIMPNNLDAREQANSYIEIMNWFISSLITNKLCSNCNIYSVPCGNHDGEFSYILNKALFNCINLRFPDIKTTLWDKYYGRFEQNNHVFYVMHGKDAQFMKKGMPLILDDKTKTLLYEWLIEQDEKGNNIHFIKGDLHSNSLTSCRKLDYRNVLSLFGASDYSNYNFSRNSYGLSYDLLVEDNLIRGTFENI